VGRKEVDEGTCQEDMMRWKEKREAPCPHVENAVDPRTKCEKMLKKRKLLP
jgi:hypothetical protein